MTVVNLLATVKDSQGHIAQKSVSFMYGVPQVIPPPPTGGNDVPMLKSWLAAQPNNSRVMWPAGSLYVVNTEWAIADRWGLTFTTDPANPCTFKRTVPTANLWSLLRFTGGGDLTLEYFKVLGDNASDARGVGNGNREWQRGIWLEGVRGGRAANLDVRHIWGDPFEFSGDFRTNTMNQDFDLEDSVLIGAGRNCISLGGGLRVHVRRVQVGRWNYVAIDCETNALAETLTDCSVEYATALVPMPGFLGTFGTSGAGPITNLLWYEATITDDPGVFGMSVSGGYQQPNYKRGIEIARCHLRQRIWPGIILAGVESAEVHDNDVNFLTGTSDRRWGTQFGDTSNLHPECSNVNEYNNDFTKGVGDQKGKFWLATPSHHNIHTWNNRGITFGDQRELSIP